MTPIDRKANEIETEFGKKILDLTETSSYLGVENNLVINLTENNILKSISSSPYFFSAYAIADMLMGNVTDNNQQNSTSSVNDISDSERLFKDWFLEYLDSLNGGVRSRTYDNHVRMAKHIIGDIGDYRLKEINKTVIKRFINGLTKKTYLQNGACHRYSQSFINKVYDLLYGAIEEGASDDGYQVFKCNYMEKIDKPRTSKYTEIQSQALSAEQIKQITQVVLENKMLNTYINILLYTGARPSEPLGLKFTDIDYGNKTIQISRTLSHEVVYDTKEDGRVEGKHIAIITDLKNESMSSKASYQRRLLKVSDRLIEILKEWENSVKTDKELMSRKKVNGTEDYLFCGTRGQFWLYRDYKQVYDRLLKKHGICPKEFTPYKFRHSYCTMLLKQGIDIKTVQLMMGDNTPDMILRVYANMNKEDVLQSGIKHSKHIDGIIAGI